MIRSLVALGCLWLPTVFVTSAEAQMIRVGPRGGVRIRVPFVGVDVSPWGDTRVRAPLTHIETRGDYYDPHYYGPPRRRGQYDRGYRGYYYPHVFSPGFGSPAYDADRRSSYGAADAPPLDSPYHPYNGAVAVPPSAPDWPADGGYSDADPVPGDERYGSANLLSPAGVAEPLRAAAQRLREELARRGEQGEIWLDYLQPDRIIAATDGEEAPESLQAVLNNFEGVTNSRVDWVLRIDGFRQTHRLLSQFVAAGSADREAAHQQDTGPRAGEPETLELPPPAPEPPPEPRAEGEVDADRADEPPSTTADSPERFSL